MGRTEDWSELIPPERQQTVELAGRWKHGWIPLDATAISSKMKGKSGGKRWWDKGGSGGNRKAVGVPKKGTKTRAQGLSEGETVASAALTRKGGPAISGSARIHKPNESRTAMIRHKITPSEAAQRGLDRKSGSFLTTKEVPGAKAQKRGSKPPVRVGTSQSAKNQIRKHQAAVARGRGESITRDLPKDYKAEGLQASKDAQARIAARRAAGGDKPHPLTRSRKPISQMSARERVDEANRADKMAGRQPDRSAEWEALARLLRGSAGKA